LPEDPDMVKNMEDRIEINIDVPAVTFSKLHSRGNQLDLATIRAYVVRAREIQEKVSLTEKY